MKAILGLFLAVAVSLTLWNGLQGGEQKETTVKGQVACAKCALGKEKTCMAVVVEKKDGKDIIYYFDKGGHDKYHPDVCPDPKDATVTGVVSEKDGKKSIVVKTVKYEK
jgi:Family of unknown function (DUF6370)